MRITRSFAVIAMAIATILSVGLASTFAQQATPTPEPGAAQGVDYPVAVHEGTCPMPTPEPAFDLSNTIVAGSDVAEGEQVGQTTGQPALVSGNPGVEVSIDDLTASPYAIAIHKSPDEFQTLVACGAIAGTLADGQLVVTLQPVQGSGISGIAFLTEEEGQTDISVYVFSPEATPATPMATPATPAS